MLKPQENYRKDNKKFIFNWEEIFGEIETLNVVTKLINTKKQIVV